MLSKHIRLIFKYLVYCKPHKTWNFEIYVYERIMESNINPKQFDLYKTIYIVDNLNIK